MFGARPAIPKAERRTAFDNFVRTRAAELLEQKKREKETQRSEFNRLLDETPVTAHSMLEGLESRWRDDPRWTALSAKQRAALFDAKVAPLRRELEERTRARRGETGEGEEGR